MQSADTTLTKNHLSPRSAQDPLSQRQREIGSLSLDTANEQNGLRFLHCSEWQEGYLPIVKESRLSFIRNMRGKRAIPRSSWEKEINQY